MTMRANRILLQIFLRQIGTGLQGVKVALQFIELRRRKNIQAIEDVQVGEGLA